MVFEESSLAQRMMKLRSTIATVLKSAPADGLQASDISDRLPTTNSMQEILGVLAVMVKREEVTRSGDKEPTYRLTGKAIATKVNDNNQAQPPKKAAPTTRRAPSVSQPTTKKKPAGTSDQPEKQERIGYKAVLEYIKAQGEVPGPDLVTRFGPSAYSYLQTLRLKGLAHVARRERNKKIWAPTVSTEPATGEPPPVTPTLPTNVFATPQSPQKAADLPSQEEFDAMTATYRIQQIVSAMHKKALADELVPPEWVGELKARLNLVQMSG